jgi:hypothetical protein
MIRATGTAPAEHGTHPEQEPTMSNPNDPQDPTTPKTVGFRAFSEKYRDRWAAGHPDAKPAKGEGAPLTPPTPTSAAPTPAVPAADGDAAGPGARP